MVSPFGIKRLGTPNAQPQLPRIDRGSPLLRQWENFSPAEREANQNRLIFPTWCSISIRLVPKRSVPKTLLLIF